jgi:hypothetical protein
MDYSRLEALNIELKQSAKPMSNYMPEPIAPVVAYTCARVLCAIERQIQTARREERIDDACSLARLSGGLRVKMFGWGFNCLLDEYTSSAAGEQQRSEGRQ